MKKDYILSSQQFSFLEKKQEDREYFKDNRKKNPLLMCKYCRASFSVGDRIIGFSSTGHSKRYHYNCAKKVNVI